MRPARILCAAAAVLLCTAHSAFCLVDINTATAVELETLPGIGPVLARRIIESRPYETIEELTRVKGIGSKSFARLKNQITVGALFPAGNQPSATEEKGAGLRSRPTASTPTWSSPATAAKTSSRSRAN